MNKKLDRLETHLQTLFEKSLPKLLIGKQTDATIIEKLIDVLRENLKEGLNGAIIAPDKFIVMVSPRAVSEWQVHQDILNEIAESIAQYGTQEGFIFTNFPAIQIESAPEILNHHWIIQAMVSEGKAPLPDTAAMPPSDNDPGGNPLPDNALLVVGGKTSFPLEKPIIDIGRHSENDLVLDDLHVSRHHAQLRAIKNNFVIFDVGSTGGIFLNGKKIVRATLQTGDVIRIGAVNLIYIQDSTAPNPTIAVPVNSETNAPGEILDE